MLLKPKQFYLNADHGDPAKLLAMQGLDALGIEASIRKRFALETPEA